MNPYLAKLREKYTAMQTACEGIQTRAAEAGVELTTVELETIKAQGEEMRALLEQINSLTAVETRNAEFAKTASALVPASGPAVGSAPAGVALGAKVEMRDPGHYRSAAEGGHRSFYGDMMRAQLLQDGEAQTRLADHNQFMRAQTTTAIAGVVPPKWLADLYTEIAQQDRAMANLCSNYTILDGRAFSLPGQTATTTVGAQTNENDAVAAGDAYDAAAVTVTPVTVVGKETVSRQLLDASTPAIDQLILADLTRSYNANIEGRIGTAIRAVGTPLAVAIADFIDPTDAAFGPLTFVDMAMAVRKALKLRATHFAVEMDMYAELLKLKDSTGRPILVGGLNGPMNAAGVADLNNDGYIGGIPVVVSDGMDATDLRAAAVHFPSVVLFESPQLTFRYEEKSGPQSIELGLWRYAAVAVRQGTSAVKNLTVDNTP